MNTFVDLYAVKKLLIRSSGLNQARRGTSVVENPFNDINREYGIEGRLLVDSQSLQNRDCNAVQSKTTASRNVLVKCFAEVAKK